MKRKFSLALCLLLAVFSFSYHSNATILKPTILSPETKPSTTRILTAPQQKTFSIQAWCQKMPKYEDLCSKTIQSDPRSYLKSNPRGLVIILVDGAKANSNSIKSLANDLLIKNRQQGGNKTTEEYIKHCAMAYDFVQTDLKVDMSQLSSPEGMEQVTTHLNDADYQIDLNCDTLIKQPYMSPLVDPLDKAVDSFLGFMRSAGAILNSIK